MNRFLFIPSDHGGGRGHVSRCLYLAELLQKNGNETAIVLEPKHYNALSSSNLNTFLLDTRKERFVKYQLEKPFKPGVRLKNHLFRRPSFIEFSSVAYQVPRDGYLTSKLVFFRFKQLVNFVERFKPDVLFGDTHFLTWMLGKKFDIPIIQITRLAGYPPQPDFMWWKSEKNKLTAPDALGPFRELINDLKLSGIKKTEDLLTGDIYIIPAIPEMEPVAEKDAHVVFSGTLVNSSDINHNIPFFDGNDNKPKIYISIGGGAGRSNEKIFFDKILSVFNDRDFNVLVSTGKRIKASSYKDLSQNVHFEDWVPGASAIHKSDLVIYHGGYGTTLEVLLSAKPAIVLPSHTEQEGNGRRLETLNIGKTILFSKERKLLEFNWPFGDYTMLAGFDFELDSDLLLNEVTDLLKSKNMIHLESIKLKLQKAQKEFDINQVLSAL